MGLTKPTARHLEVLHGKRVHNDGGYVLSPYADLWGGTGSAPSGEDAKDLLLFFQINSEHGVNVQAVSLSIEFPHNFPFLLELSSRTAGEKTAEVLIAQYKVSAVPS